MELFNISEITQIATGQSYEPGHEGLLVALRSRYPHAEFILTATRGRWSSIQKGLVDAGGKIISDDFAKWMTAEYKAAGQDPRVVWEKYKDSGLLMSEEQGTTLYIASPFASSPDSFIQIEIELVHEVANRLAFDAGAWTVPDDLDDLLNPLTGITDPKEIKPYRYRFSQMTNIRRFCQELVELEHQNRIAQLPEMEKKVVRVATEEKYEKTGPLTFEFHQEVEEIPFLEFFPDWLDRPRKEIRYFKDWEESSAGRSGARLCDHWFLQTTDYTNRDGVRTMSFIPQWADADGGSDLPILFSPDRNDAYGVMSLVEKFDTQVGYPFAWFFYMLHGNRIDHTVGETIVRGLQAGKIRLPEWDDKVLMRWHEREYGF